MSIVLEKGVGYVRLTGIQGQTERIMDTNRIQLALLLFILIFSTACQNYEDELPTTADDQTRNSGLVAVFSVVGNSINAIQEGSASTGFYNQTRQEQLWAFFSQLIPASARTNLTELELYADEEDGTAAFVSPINDNDLSKWLMGFNLDFVWDAQGNFVEGETAYTAIHEVAHLLTLNSGQLNVNGRVSTCTNFFPGEGCSLDQSYINTFFNQFWTGIYAEHQGINEDDFDAIDAFYRKYPNQFVTDYAATNVGEDIAESFTYFVMDDLPNGNAISDQKIRFFENYPELVSLRQEIRANINFSFNLNQINGVRSERARTRVGGHVN